MTSHSQNDYYYNNEIDALSYNSRPISSINYNKPSSFGLTTDPKLLKHDRNYHASNSETISTMYDNYGSVVASPMPERGNCGGANEYGGGGNYYQNTSRNDNDIFQSQNPQHSQNSYAGVRFEGGRGGNGGTYYNGSCDNMYDYSYGENNRISGRHSSMSTTAKQLPQIPMKHSSSMVDGISYSRGASLPTTPPVAHKKSRMLPQPTAANGGIGGNSGKCLPATPRVLPRVNSNNKLEPSARSGTGRKLLPTPNQKPKQTSDVYKTTNSRLYNTGIMINQKTYNNVPHNSSISNVSYKDYTDYTDYNCPPSSCNNDTDCGGSRKVTSRDLYNSRPTATVIEDHQSYPSSSIHMETTSSNTYSLSGYGGIGRKLPKRLPTPNVKNTSNGSVGKLLPKLPSPKSQNQNKSLFTVSANSTAASSGTGQAAAATSANSANSVNFSSMDFSKSYLPYSYTSQSPSMTSTNNISVSSSFDINKSNHSSNLYPPSNSSITSVQTTATIDYHNSYMQTSVSALSTNTFLNKPSANNPNSNSTAVTTTRKTATTSSYYDDDGNATSQSYLNKEYHSLKSYPPEITTTTAATFTSAITSTSVTTPTTTTNSTFSTSSFSVSDYLKKFDLKTPMMSESSTTTTVTSSTTTSTATAKTTSTTISNDIKICQTCHSVADECDCYMKLSNETSSYYFLNPSTSSTVITCDISLSDVSYTKPSTTLAVTSNYSSYISDYLNMYSSTSNYSYGTTSTSKTISTGTTIAPTISSYMTSYLSSDYTTSLGLSEIKTTTAEKTLTAICDQNGCAEYISSKPKDTMDYFTIPVTTSDYSEYLSIGKPTEVTTTLANSDNLSSYKYFESNSGYEFSTPIATTVTVTASVSFDMSSSYTTVNSGIYTATTSIDDLYSNYSPTPTVTTVASNDDPYAYLDAYKVDFPVYSMDLGSGSDSYTMETYTEPNYSTSISKTHLDVSNNEYYEDYRSSTTTPIPTDYKSYLYETNSNSGSGSGSSSNVSGDHLLAKYDLTTSSSASLASGSTVVTTRNTTVTSGVGYYQPSMANKTAAVTSISTNINSNSTTSTPQKVTAAAANKASSMFGSLSHGLKGGLDGVLSGVAAVADSTKQQQNQQQQPQQQSAASGIKSSAKSFGFGFASKLIPNLGGVGAGTDQSTKTAITNTTTKVSPFNVLTNQSKETMAISKAADTTAAGTGDITPQMKQQNQQHQQMQQQQYMSLTTGYENYEYRETSKYITCSDDVTTWNDWTGIVDNSQPIYVTDSLIYDTDYNQIGSNEQVITTTTGEYMKLDDSCDSILTRQSSFDGSQQQVVKKTTNGVTGGKIVDYSDDYKYGYDEYSYSENDYIATGDITDNQNYNNNYDYMDDDATIVSQLLDNAAEKMAEEAYSMTTTAQQNSQTTSLSARSVASSFDGTTSVDMVDKSSAPPVQVTATMITTQAYAQHQQATAKQTTAPQQQQPKLGPTSLLSSLTSAVAIGGQQQQSNASTKSSSNSGGGGGLFGSFLGKAAAAVQSATQVVSSATAMTTAAVNVVPSAFSGDQKNVSATPSNVQQHQKNRHDTEMSNTVVSGASGAAVVSSVTSTSIDDYENSNLYEDDYYATSTTTTNTPTNANSNLAQKMLPTVPMSTGKKLPPINGKSGLLMKQQPTEIYDEEEEEFIDELDPNYRMDSEQDDYFMDQTAPSTIASMMAMNGYYVPPDSGYDYREDYFNEEDEYKYLEKEQQLKDLRHQQLMQHQKQPPLEYIEESRDDYIDDNYPSEDSANYIDDRDTINSKDSPLQVPLVTTTTSAGHIQQQQQQQLQQSHSIATTVSMSLQSTINDASLQYVPIKKQDSIIDDDDIVLTPDDSLKTDDQLNQLHQEPQLARKKTLTRGETEEVTSGQLLKRKPEITARQRWNWAYNKIIMQLNVSTIYFYQILSKNIRNHNRAIEKFILECQSRNFVHAFNKVRLGRQIITIKIVLELKILLRVYVGTERS